VKRYLLFSITFLFSCTVSPTIDSYEKSNQFFLERTINRVNLAQVTNFLDLTDKVIVVGLEIPNSNDKAPLALVEDRVIEKLVSAGYTVLERDKELVEVLVKESDSIQLLFETGKGGKSETIFYSTKLPAATKIVSYRIEEFGYRFRPHMENRNLKVREGVARIRFRVQEAKTGKLLYSDVHQMVYQDNQTEEEIERFKKFEYGFYSHQYPVVNKIDTSKTKLDPIEPEKVSAFEQMEWYTEPQIVLRSGAGTGFGVRYGLADTKKRLTGQLYYSVSEANHYSLNIFYDGLFKIPTIMNLNQINFVTRAGVGFTNNKQVWGFGLVLGGGLEVKYQGLHFHLGWNHTLPFQKETELWTNDFVFSMIFRY
jgi:hypothetical protein